MRNFWDDFMDGISEAVGAMTDGLKEALPDPRFWAFMLVYLTACAVAVCTVMWVLAKVFG